MEALIDEILAKLNELPESRLREVLHFVSLIDQCETDDEKNGLSEEPLLEIAGILSGKPLSAQAIEAELYGH